MSAIASSLRIRLLRRGCVNRPFYHIIAVHKDTLCHHDGYEQLGTYDPMPNERNEKLLSLNIERFQYWLAQDASVGPSVELTHISTSESAKEEILANLANFAYDPQNYDYFIQLNIPDLFLNYVDDSNDNLIEFAIGGLCNIALDRTIKEHLLQNNIIDKIVVCLSNTREEIVLSAITTLMCLVTPQSKVDITRPSIIQVMLQLSKSSSNRIKNLANIFLQDYCTPQQIHCAQNN